MSAKAGVRPTSRSYKGAKPKEGKIRHRVGFFGCSGRLVKVERHQEGRDPHTCRLDCPVCGREHPVKIMWRNMKDPDKKTRGGTRWGPRAETTPEAEADLEIME